MKPVLLAQLSDLHLGAAWEGVDPVPRLEQVIEAVRSLPNPVDAVIVTGDLSDSGSGEDYLLARRLLDRFDAPVHVLPGNHDLRGPLRQVFGLPGEGEEPIDYSVEVGELRLVVLDSIVPGQDPGGFAAEQLRRLDEELGRQPEQPTLLAMHHPPLPTGHPEWDAINLAASERAALAEVVGRHPQLRAIAGGHLHRVGASALAGCPVLAAPSTYLQMLPDYVPADFEDDDAVVWTDPPGFALHVLLDGELSSQVEMLGRNHGG
ncbi:MAG TPA: phosphodiesterase [Solirubrobacterales bacterium]|nr:phosphodiesterase [Solirubrobacterales bacterium]